MDVGIAFVLIPIIIALVAAGAYWSYLQQKKRREALDALAGQLGWQFTAERDYDHDDQFAHFEIFRHGHSRFAYNTLRGSLEVDGRTWPAKMGDFHYKVTSSNGKTTTTHTYRFSYLILHLPFARVPDLLVRREGMFDALKSMMGFDDIDFESAEFSKRFFVKSPDKRFAYDVIHPRMMEFLLDRDVPTIDIENGRCCISDGKHTWSPEEFRSRLEFAGRFLRPLAGPPHVDPGEQMSQRGNRQGRQDRQRSVFWQIRHEIRKSAVSAKPQTHTFDSPL